jgi:hypothetical protein
MFETAEKMHMTHDEVVCVRRGGEAFSCRMRIWRHADAPAVILVSQLTDGPNPCDFAGRVVNHIYRNILFYPTRMPSFWFSVNEETPAGRPTLMEIRWKIYGCEYRAALCDPTPRKRHWCELECEIGQSAGHDD